jgi:hypothetical protein
MGDGIRGRSVRGVMASCWTHMALAYGSTGLCLFVQVKVRPSVQN